MAIWLAIWEKLATHPIGYHDLEMQRQRFSSQNSCAAIVTDPSPEWLIGKNVRTWQKRPLFYLNYGLLEYSVQNSLSEINAVAISKDASSGQPKIDAILDLCD
jgi:hypothetical protein